MVTQRKFLKISISCHPALEEALCNFLFERGALGLELDQTDEKLSTIQGFFNERKGTKSVRTRFEALAENLQRLFPEIPKARCKVALFPERDWEKRWKKDFKPLKISPDLIVQPSWWKSEKPPKNGTMVLKIDPKTAFGTGHHPSTRLCLLALSDLVKPGDKVLDYGCGSGILGIYAAKIGATEILGIDNNPEAICCAEENVVINRVRRRVKIKAHPRSIKTDYYDIAVANIDLTTLTELVTRIAGAVKPGGLLLFSGILSAESSSTRSLLNRAGVTILKTYREEGWITVVGRKGTAYPPLR